MQCLFLTVLVVLMPAIAQATPIMLPKGKTFARASVSNGTSDELYVGGDRAGWKLSNFSIAHNLFNLEIRRGIIVNSEVIFSISWKDIEAVGDEIPSGTEDGERFRGWSDASFGYNKNIFEKNNFYGSLLYKFTAPASQYNPNQLITPGILAPEHYFGFEFAYMGTWIPIYFEATAGRALRTGDRSPDQDRFQSSLYFIGKREIQFGVFYGGVSATSGVDLMSDEFREYASKSNDAGHAGMPFPRLKDKYDYLGVGVNTVFGDYEVGLSYLEKVRTSIRNSDSFTSITFALGQYFH